MKIRTMRVFASWVFLWTLGAFASSAQADYASVVNSLGPSVYYRLDEASSGTVFDSSVTNGFSGATHAAGAVGFNQPGGAVDGGTNGYLQASGFAVDLTGIHASNLVTGNQDFTVSMWVKPDNFSAGDWGTYYFMGDWAPGQSLILNERGDGSGKVGPGVHSGDFGTSLNPMNLGQWNHVAMSYNATTTSAKLFLNGNLETVTDISAAGLPSGASLNIGPGANSGLGAPSNNAQPFDGGIDEFAFFQKTLTDIEVMTLASPTGQPPLPPPPPPPPPPNPGFNPSGYATFVNSLSPTLYYQLNEAGLGTVFDSSGNGNDATHAGAATPNQANGAIAGDSALGTSGFAVDLTGVEASALVSGSQDFSVSIWVKPADFGNGDFGTFLYLGKNGCCQEGLIMAEDGVAGTGLVLPGVFGANIGPGGGAGTIPMNLDEWNHIGATYDATSETFTQYVNGQLDFSINRALDIGSGGSSLGSLGLGLGQNFAGAVDEFAFFRTVLGPDDMANLANASIPEPTSVLLLSLGAFGLLMGCRRSKRG